MLLETPSRTQATDHRLKLSVTRFQGAGADRCAPPRGFRSAEGVRRAWLSGGGPFGRTPSLRGKSAAQKAGIRYERKVNKELSLELGAGFDSSVWFRYNDASGERWCQVDGLWWANDGETAVIFEVKSRFTSDGWYQLRLLYEPVVRAALQPKRIQHVLICKSFDPAMPFPEDFNLIPSVRSPLEPGVVSVLPWRL